MSLAFLGSRTPPKVGAMRHSSTDRARSLLLALVAASTVANLYYSQPVLASMGSSWGISAGGAAGVVVATLIGNGLAQFLLVPLADFTERRRLAQILLCVQALGMLVVASSAWFPVAVLGSVVVGVGGSAAMVLLPYAASLAAPEARGRVTGLLMSGVLLGILFSRSISGFISAASSWRLTYVLGGLIAGAAAVSLARSPRSRAEERPSSYRRLLGSVAHLGLRDRLVQQRMAVGVLGFISFNILWTGLTLLLSGPAYHQSDSVIGLYGLIGLAGAAVARNAGQWFDHGRGRLVSRLGWCATAAAWIVSILAGHGGAAGVVSVIVAVALLDCGMQAQHITNQATLLAARPEQTGRVTTAYMSACVLAGAIGSALASTLYSAHGWIALAATGTACSVAALCLLVPRPGSAHTQVPADTMSR